MCGDAENNAGSSPSTVDGVSYITTYPIVSREDNFQTKYVDGSDPISFALFGLDRMGDRHWPKWVDLDFTKPVLDLGPGQKVVPGAERLDWPQYDWEPKLAHRWFSPEEAGNEQGMYRTEIFLKGEGALPYDDDSVGGIVCVNLLEHLWDPRPLIWECARVLAPGCPMNVFVPHVDSIMYKQDLDHKKQFILDTWKNLLDNPYYPKGHSNGHRLKIGVNFKFAVKEGNEACVTQLVKG